MTTITLKQMQNNFDKVISQALTDNYSYTISTDGGAVVLISEREWNEMKETLHLLKDKKSLDALLDGHQKRTIGSKPVSMAPEQAFYDLQN